MLLDCPENTSEEERQVRKKLAPYQMEDFLAELGVAVISKSAVYDNFTHYVQKMVAFIVYKNQIPQDPPNKKKDTPELYADKVFLQNAMTGAIVYKEEHEQNIKKLHNFYKHEKLWESLIVSAIVPTTTSLLGEEDIQTLKDAHTVLHLSDYISAIIIEFLEKNREEWKEKNFMNLWEYMTTPALCNLSVSEWKGSNANSFVEKLGKIWMLMNTLF